MKIIDQSFEIISLPEKLLQIIEKAGRTCYKTEGKITPTSAEAFVKMLLSRGHHAMIEFGDIIVRIVTDRGVTHEIVRHRLSSYAQESTRYVNYGDKEIEFIRPPWCPEYTKGEYLAEQIARFSAKDVATGIWINSLFASECAYKALLKEGWRAEQARNVLPNSLKTEIVWKANIREWRHIFTLRCSKAAHPQMQDLMRPLLAYMQENVPVVFDDIKY